MSEGDPGLILTFGEHRDKAVEECPSSYLRWLEKAVDKNRPAVAAAARTELEFRDKHDAHWEKDN